MNRCDLHTILRLPSGIFYSPGVKTNVLFFTRGRKNTGNTRAVWIYDMRHDAPRYGKKRPLQAADFSSFEAVYGVDLEAMKLRKDQGKGGRWRCFSREEIAEKFDNLNISWLSETEADPEDGLTEPDDISAAILLHLRAALSEIEAVADELAESSETDK
jgi:type I restriction enzyme M protein